MGQGIVAHVVGKDGTLDLEIMWHVQTAITTMASVQNVEVQAKSRKQSRFMNKTKIISKTIQTVFVV